VTDPVCENEEEKDLILGFLDGTHLKSPTIEEVKIPLADTDFNHHN
jgi:hypothetical protein